MIAVVTQKIQKFLYCLDNGVDQSAKTDGTKGSCAGALQAGPSGRSRPRLEVVGGKDARDGDMDNVGQDLREPVEGKIGDNVQNICVEGRRILLQKTFGGVQ